MIDPFGRSISYLRVSVHWNRCDVPPACTAWPEDHDVFCPRPDLLTLEELERMCAAFIPPRRQGSCG